MKNIKVVYDESDGGFKIVEKQDNNIWIVLHSGFNTRQQAEDFMGKIYKKY
jgi:hypothetical protein